MSAQAVFNVAVLVLLQALGVVALHSLFTLGDYSIQVLSDSPQIASQLFILAVFSFLGMR